MTAHPNLRAVDDDAVLRMLREAGMPMSLGTITRRYNTATSHGRWQYEIRAALERLAASRHVEQVRGDGFGERWQLVEHPELLARAYERFTIAPRGVDYEADYVELRDQDRQLTLLFVDCTTVGYDFGTRLAAQMQKALVDEFVHTNAGPS